MVDLMPHGTSGVALVRRLYHHALSGGKVTASDMARIVEIMEQMDNESGQLRDQVAILSDAVKKTEGGDDV